MLHSFDEYSPVQQSQFDYGDERARIALILEYNGKALAGSQFQPSIPTVQGYVQDALAKLQLRASPMTLAGRTDTGVSALGQVAHFDLTSASKLDSIANLPLASVDTYLAQSP